MNSYVPIIFAVEHILRSEGVLCVSGVLPGGVGQVKYAEHNNYTCPVTLTNSLGQRGNYS